MADKPGLIQWFKTIGLGFNSLSLSFLKKAGKYSVPLVLSAIGLCAGWGLSTAFLSGMSKAIQTKTEIKKDTLNINILNGGALLTRGSNPAVSTGSSGATGSTGKPLTTRQQPTGVTGSTGEILPLEQTEFTPLAQMSKSVALINDSIQNRQWLAKRGGQTSLPVGLLLYLGVLIIILIAVWFRYYTQQVLNIRLEMSRDPKELQDLFDFADKDIEKLGIPRKIKRFSNKVRLQYYLLKNSGVLTHKNMKLFMDILLAIEHERIKVQDSAANGNGADNKMEQTLYKDVTTRSLEDFKTFLSGLAGHDGKLLYIKGKSSNKFIEEIYKNNRNLIV